MRDPFSYSARWNSIGLDCAYCTHDNNVVWPNLERDYRCMQHNLDLSMQLGSDGFKAGEWFCRSFEHQTGANTIALREFEGIRDTLSPTVLYGGHSGNGNLKEVKFINLLERN